MALNFDFIKRHLKIAVTIALCFFVLYAGIYVYLIIYSYSVNFSLVYPGIEKGQYPNGERFMMYDFIENERIQEALDIFQKKGWYTDISTSEILKNLNVKAYLKDPVQERVNNDRKTGEDFSYYSNEYVLTFNQPVKFDIKKIGCFFGLFPENHAKEFLNELVNANLQYIMTTYSDNKMGYLNLTASTGDLKNDYSDIVDYYNGRIGACVAFLYEKEAEGKTYMSSSTGQSFGKLIISYQNLMDIDVSKLSSYVKTNRLTGQIWQYTNRSNVTLERLSQTINKSLDESAIAKDAMNIYDHTFTEHIVVVAQNEEDGLYQAHPKTGYDTITQQTLNASVTAAESQEMYNNLSKEITQYTDLYYNNPQYPNLIQTANQMVSEIDQRFHELNDITMKTLNEYLLKVNNDYMRITAQQRVVITWNEIIKSIFVFIFFLLSVFGYFFIHDKTKKLSRKHRNTRPSKGILME